MSLKKPSVPSKRSQKIEGRIFELFGDLEFEPETHDPERAVSLSMPDGVEPITTRDDLSYTNDKVISTDQLLIPAEDQPVLVDEDHTHMDDNPFVTDELFVPTEDQIGAAGSEQTVENYRSAASGGSPVLVARELRKQYILGKHKVNALDGVEFLVKEGEFVAIMGPSGSGKSTLLHLIGGLDLPTDGEVLLANKPLSLMKDKTITLLRRRNVGFVFQFFNLLPTLSAEENIILPILIDGKNVKHYKERLENILDLVGIKDRRRHKPEQLSGGEQQRVAIARALITEPTIVLADEPTGNLDTKTGTTIMSLLRRSCDELGQTIVIVTHDPRAASYADRVVFLRDGHIINNLIFDKAAGSDDQVEASKRLRLIIEQMERIET